MRYEEDIRALLDALDQVTADDLEDQDLDFKEWKGSLDHMVKLVREMAVCMANGGGGTVVFGVADKVLGRAAAVRGLPPEVDINRLKKSVYDTTDPKLTPVFEEIAVPEGSGRLLAMQIHPGMPPYTDTSGRAKIRIGKNCQPLTGTLRKKLMVETGESDVTAELLEVPWQSLVSPAAMEVLRAIAGEEKAPRELLALSDEDFLNQLQLLKKGKLTKAGLLLCGKSGAILSIFPSHVWTFLRMGSDTDYRDRKDGSEALPIALREMEQRIQLDNPIRTLELGLIHPEVRAYPQIALREALMNAFCHADYRLPGPILVKQYPARIEISNPGGFIGGITEGNILHHPPVPRNPALVEALAKLRLVNAPAELKQGLIHSFLSEVGSDLADSAYDLEIEDLGERMRIVRGPVENRSPLNVGLMFFTSDPRKWFPQTQIDVVQMPDGPGGNTLIEKTFSGPVSSMLRDALAYLRNQFVTEYVRKHPDREAAERYFNLPYAALEEAVANAVYHRSYEEREPIEKRITPDEVTVLSFPGPDRSINMDDLRAGRAVARRYRNRRIGEFLKELDLTEGRSTGIPTIL